MLYHKEEDFEITKKEITVRVVPPSSILDQFHGGTLHLIAKT